MAFAASAAIITVGAFAALSQIQIAPAIVNGLFYAILATIVGVTVIAVGGGGIKAMSSRWENALAKYDAEKPRINEERQGASERIKERAQQRAQQAKAQGSGGGEGGTRHEATQGATSGQRR